MSSTLTEKEFSEHVNTKFRVMIEPPVELELSGVKGYSSGPNEQTGMERFSIFFTGPGDRYLRQQVYSLEHERMGSFDVFLVPIALNEGCYRYEAVFNYFKE